jgi:peptide deformylase
MAVLPLRLFGDPVLTTPAEPVRTFDAELRRLVRNLDQTLYDQRGSGLAAPQVGVGLRVFAFHDEHETDHLDGVLFLDRMDAGRRKAAMRAIRHAGWLPQLKPSVKLSPHPMTHGYH